MAKWRLKQLRAETVWTERKESLMEGQDSALPLCQPTSDAPSCVVMTSLWLANSSLWQTGGLHSLPLVGCPSKATRDFVSSPQLEKHALVKVVCIWNRKQLFLFNYRMCYKNLRLCFCLKMFSVHFQLWKLSVCDQFVPGITVAVGILQCGNHSMPSHAFPPVCWGSLCGEGCPEGQQFRAQK